MGKEGREARKEESEGRTKGGWEGGREEGKVVVEKKGKGRRKEKK